MVGVVPGWLRRGGTWVYRPARNASLPPATTGPFPGASTPHKSRRVPTPDQMPTGPSDRRASRPEGRGVGARGMTEPGPASMLCRSGEFVPKVRVSELTGPVVGAVRSARGGEGVGIPSRGKLVAWMDPAEPLEVRIGELRAHGDRRAAVLPHPVARARSVSGADQVLADRER